MHHLYTTEAFIMSSTPHGESNRVYRLLTETHGLLYAHAQGVRELRNRNRYVLRTATLVSLTLVKGRDIWRITSARPIGAGIRTVSPTHRKLLDLISRLTSVEDPHTQMFHLFHAHVQAYEQVVDTERDMVELVSIVRLLMGTGYLTAHREGRTLIDRICMQHDDYTPALLRDVYTQRTVLLQAVNSALRAAAA